MNDTIKENLKKTYLSACISAVSAAFISVVSYPAEHGIKSTGRATIAIVAFAMIGLFLVIVVKAMKERELDTAREVGEFAVHRRLKKMAQIWFAFAVLLASSLVRYPAVKWYREIGTLTDRDLISVAAGSILIAYFLFRLVATARIPIPADSIAPESTESPESINKQSTDL